MSDVELNVGLEEIEAQCSKYAQARAALRQVVARAEADFERVRSAHRRALVLAVDQSEDERAALFNLVSQARRLFDEPKSFEFHGVKLGWKKGRGKVEWADDDLLIERIRKVVPDQEMVLVKTTRKPIAAALSKLDAATLKRLGVSISGTDDEPFVAAADSALEKMVAVLTGQE